METVQNFSYILLIVAYLGFMIPHYFLELIRHFKSKFTIIIYSFSIFLICSSIFYILFLSSSNSAFDPFPIIVFASLLILFIIINFIYTYFYITLTKYWIRLVRSDDKRKNYIIDLALHNLKSSNLETKQAALQQLYELSLNERAYYGIIDFIHKEKNQQYQYLSIQYLCKINKKRAEYINNSCPLVN